MLATILVIAAGCFVLERLVPGRPLPPVRGWYLRVFLINLVQLGVVLAAGVSWERWLSEASLFELGERFGAVPGGLFAYFIATFVLPILSACASAPADERAAPSQASGDDNADVHELAQACEAEVAAAP